MDHAALRAAYSRFLRPGRILLSGHSHQAWPDVAREAQLQVFDDAADAVDDKWERIFAIQAEVGRRILLRMGFAADDAIAFGESSHQLAFRLLSTLDTKRAHVVTTTSEFHSLHRQLARLAEEGMRVTWVDAQPRAGLTERLIEAIAPGTSLVALSAVLFEDAFVVENIGRIVARAREVGAIPLVDAYHAFNVVPIAWGDTADVYATAGGYKYAGFGNGLCWLRIPPGCALRPVYTGWFADFDGLARPRTNAPGVRGVPAEPVAYGPGGMRFAGATFDASALYRARAVLDHWDRFGLDPPRLRAISLRQTRRIIEHLTRSDGTSTLSLVSARDDARRGGFVAFRHREAGALQKELKRRGVFVDSRADILRVGPAPFLNDEEIDRGCDIIAETALAL